MCCLLRMQLLSFSFTKLTKSFWILLKTRTNLLPSGGRWSVLFKFTVEVDIVFLYGKHSLGQKKIVYSLYLTQTKDFNTLTNPWRTYLSCFFLYLFRLSRLGNSQTPLIFLEAKMRIKWVRSVVRSLGNSRKCSCLPEGQVIHISGCQA